MNRKEMGCAVVGAVLGAAGCSPAAKSLIAPVADAQESLAVAPGSKSVPHVSDIILSLISGTSRDISSALIYLEPHSGWSIHSSDDRLDATIANGHVATLVAPEDKEVHFIANVTITHADGTHLRVRCHVEAGCTA